MNDNIRNESGVIRGANGSVVDFMLDSHGVSVGEVALDVCNICFYSSGTKIQKVKQCSWMEDGSVYSMLMCKPCFDSLKEINLPGGSNE